MSKPSAYTFMTDIKIPPSQGIYEESTTQQAPLGARITVGDRTFVYAKLSTSANVAAGFIVCAPQLIASHQSGIVACASASAGSKTITITAGTLFTANQYAEGYIGVALSASAGAGLMLRIKSHPAIATAATGAITLYDEVPYVIAGGPVNFVPNQFADVKVASAALDRPVGVTPVAVTTGNYFWLQTYGPAAMRHVAANAADALLTLGTLGAATVGLNATTNDAFAPILAVVGRNMNLAATAAQANPAFITLMP